MTEYHNKQLSLVLAASLQLIYKQFHNNPGLIFLFEHLTTELYDFLCTHDTLQASAIKKLIFLHWHLAFKECHVSLETIRILYIVDICCTVHSTGVVLVYRGV